jgi:hypothetical protein
MTDRPAGWHPDPDDNSVLRYWNGSAWTDDSPQELAEDTPIASNTPTKDPVFGDGTFLVGTDIEPGIYRSCAQSGAPAVIWKRLNSVRGDLKSNIAITVAPHPSLGEIVASDFAFFSKDSGGWARVA